MSEATEFLAALDRLIGRLDAIIEIQRWTLEARLTAEQLNSLQKVINRLRSKDYLREPA